MRTAAWAGACVVGGVLVALVLYGTARATQDRTLPRVAEMTASCITGVTAPAGSATAASTRCRRYFVDLAVLRRTVATQAVISAPLAIFVLLVLRFRVYPLVGGRRPRAAPRRPVNGTGGVGA